MIRIYNKNGNWTEGFVGEYDFVIKHFEQGSEFGIEQGKISKLEIRKNGKVLARYDRGWNIEPKGAVIEAYKKILAEFN